MNLAEKKLSSKKIFDGKIMQLFVDGVSLPDGSESFREYVVHSGGAAVLMIKDGKVALVKQFRYAYGEETYEIPAGKLNEGEEPSVGAARELEEETGYRAQSLSHLVDIYPSPGYTNEIIHIYLAENIVKVGQKLDEGEFLNCTYVPLDEVVKMIERGEIKDAKTVVAIYKYIAEHGVK